MSTAFGTVSSLCCDHNYGGPEVQSCFAFTVRRSPSFVAPVPRFSFTVRRHLFCLFLVRGSPFAVAGVSCVVRGSRLPVSRSPFSVTCSQLPVSRSLFVVRFLARRSRTYDNLLATHGKNCMPTLLAASSWECNQRSAQGLMTPRCSVFEDLSYNGGPATQATSTEPSTNKGN